MQPAELFHLLLQLRRRPAFAWRRERAGKFFHEARAGVRSETLSRLRKRSSCDLSKLQALAAAVGLHT